MLDKLVNLKKSENEIFLKELQKNTIDKAKLQKLLHSDKVDINHTGSNNKSYLHICLEEKKINSAIWLIDQGIDLDILSTDELSPFDIAVQNQNHRVAKKLLEKKLFDLNIKNNFGRTLLQDAVVLGDHDMARILIEHGADLNSKDNKDRNVLFDALSYGNMEFIEYLLEHDNLDLNYQDIEKDTPMHHNFILNHDQLAIKFIKKGANPNIPGKEGKSYFSLLALNGEDGLKTIENIVEEGIDINARVADDKTILMELMSALFEIKPLDASRRHSLINITKTLINQNADINALNSNNENVLFDAVKLGEAEQVAMLLKAGAKVNVQNKDGETALSLSAYGGVEKVDITALLIQYGADPFIENKNGKSLYEVLNELILSNHGKKTLVDNDILKYALEGTRFIHVLREILENTKPWELNRYDSTGNPMCFMPLLYNSIPLFRLYLINGSNVGKLNREGKNIFYEYVLKVFNDDDKNVDFHSGLSMLISAKVEHNAVDETGWTVISKVIGTTPCNIDLFKTLVKVVRFDYKIVDKLGRSAIHSAIWKGNLDVIKIINYIDKDIKDIPDHYGILPVIYAALLGNKELVFYFIGIKAKLSTKVPISKSAIKKFSPLLKNIEALREEVDKSSDDMHNMEIVINQLRKDFVIT